MAENSSNNWRDTLYVWDGIVIADIPPGDGSTPPSVPVPLQWKGAWVPIEGVPDATTAEAPKRNAFKRDIDADCKFSVEGIATPVPKTGNETTDEEQPMFVVKLVGGTGWEMKDDGDANGNGEAKKATHTDEVHDVLVRTIRWSGNQKDERESLIVAKGTNNFGPFCSVGWMRPGCRWTLARRYLAETDPRVKWSLSEFYAATVKEVIDVVEAPGDIDDGEKTLRIPPWQASVMHASYKSGDEPTDSGIGRGKRQRVNND